MRRQTVLSSPQRVHLPAMIAVTAAIVLGVAWMFLSPGAAAVVSPRPVTLSLTDGPLAKFAKLMPVVVHPRCINCHGNVDPFNQLNHVDAFPPDERFVEGDVRRDEISGLLDENGDHRFDMNNTFNLVCLECHTDPDAKLWTLAPKRVSFVNKTAGEICRLWQTSKHNSSQQLKDHLHTDPLARLALVKGNKGIDGAREEKPPLELGQFLKFADDWLEGSEEIRCGGWEGTITQTESVDLTTNHTQSGGGIEEHTTEAQHANRTTEITIGGSASVRITVQGTETIDNTIVTRDGGQSCTTTMQTARVYGTTDGVSSVEARSAKVTFFPAGGAYRLTIVGPEEQTTRVERISSTMCVIGRVPDSNETLTFDHDPWTIEIDSVFSDPSDQTHLKGNKTETKKLEHQAWLTANGGNVAPLQTRDNGELLPVPVEVTTRWDLRLRTDD